ncbi:MAG: hypothetical protein Q7U41_00260 [Microbacterium sp.]|nr:hypothetical protein [Microbacterium sp.]
MLRIIQPHPLRRSPLAIGGVSMLLGALLGFRLFNELPDAWPWAAAIGVAAFVAIVVTLCMRLAWPPISFDERDAVLRVGLRRIPIASIVAVVRKIAVGTGSAGITYHLLPEQGRRVRVLIASSAAVRGLNADERAALLAALERSRIPAHLPVDARGQLTAFLSSSKHQEPLGLNTLRVELGIEEPEPPQTTTASGAREAAVTAPVAAPTPDIDDLAPQVDPAQLAEQWAADDLAAAAELERRTVGPRRASRITLAVLGVVVVAWILVMLLVGDDLPDEWGAVIGIGGLPVAFALYLLWDGLVDREVRRGRHVGIEWMRTAGPAARARGLPLPLHAPWLRSARNLRSTVAFLLQPLAGLLIIVAILLFVEYPVEVPAWVPMLLLVLVVAFIAIGIWYLVWARGAKRRDVEWLITAAGPRFGL